MSQSFGACAGISSGPSAGASKKVATSAVSSSVGLSAVDVAVTGSTTAVPAGQLRREQSFGGRVDQIALGDDHGAWVAVPQKLRRAALRHRGRCRSVIVTRLVPELDDLGRSQSS
jgi:hypothetical protein